MTSNITNANMCIYWLLLLLLFELNMAMLKLLFNTNMLCAVFMLFNSNGACGDSIVLAMVNAV